MDFNSGVEDYEFLIEKYNKTIGFMVKISYNLNENSDQDDQCWKKAIFVE